MQVGGGAAATQEAEAGGCQVSLGYRVNPLDSPELDTKQKVKRGSVRLRSSDCMWEVPERERGSGERERENGSGPSRWTVQGDRGG